MAESKSAESKTLLQEFKDFISKGNAIDLAVGITVGTAFTALVTSLVKDIIMPPLGLILNNVSFTDLFVSLNKQTYPTLAAAQAAGAPVIAYGLFINNIINFLIISAAIFGVVKAVNKLKKEKK